jgi:hypothetical protein
MMSTVVKFLTSFVLLVLAASPGLIAQRGAPDPAFSKIPFNDWMKAGEQAQIRWSVRFSMIGLSAHQRLRARIGAQVDGNEITKHSGKGRLVVLFQLSDTQGGVYQTHQMLEFKDITGDPGKVDIQYFQDVFLLPGDYSLSAVIFDTATHERSVAKRTLRVPAMKNDPLPEAWRDLPPVEFLTAVDPPDVWFQPDMGGRLNLPLETKRPVRIEVLVNASPTEFTSRVGRASNMNMAVLMPTLKVLTEVQPRNGTVSAALLDLSRRRVSFEQKIERDLDWSRMKAALSEANPNLIDVRSLENREQNAQFLVDEVKRRVAPETVDPVRIVIVLSGPMSFRSSEDLRPIDLGKGANYRVYYVRCHPFQIRPIPIGFDAPDFRRGIPGPIPLPPRGARTQIDSLERTLKPVESKLFDIDSPDQFRKALATMLTEMARTGSGE